MTMATERATAAQLEFVEALAGELPDMARMSSTDARAIMDVLRGMSKRAVGRLINVLKAQRSRRRRGHC